MYASLNTTLNPKTVSNSINPQVNHLSPKAKHPWRHSVERKHRLLDVKFEVRFVMSFPRKFMSNKKTHINCGSSARMAGNICANADQIRRQGRWNNTTINGTYLTNLPRELVRSMAGFPTYGRFFYLARAALNPPTSLSKKLFPAIGE
jgi:hypothetical protein